MKKLFFIAALIGLLASCNNSVKEQPPKGVAIDLKSYSQGQKLYSIYCQQCHKEKGQGMPPSFPPLANADYLMADKNRAACIIKYGNNGPITVNGEEYRLRMVGYEQMNPQDIADILTFVTNSWGNKGGTISRADVSKALQHCKPKN